MNKSNNSQMEIAMAWDHFVKTGELGNFKVRPQIRESWERCFSAGVDPEGGKSHRIIRQPELGKLLEANEEMINVARPLMAEIYNFVQGSGFIVMLTDERGYIIESFGDAETLENALGINFINGASWIEEQVGTNAIGTALFLLKPIQVSGVEHYCRLHHVWTCSAAPIFSDTGKLLGILDVSGPSHATHLHTLGMVVAAAEATMEQLKIRQKNRELTVTNNRLTNTLDSMSDGVIYVDKLGIVHEVNPSAERILGTSAENLINGSIQQLCKTTMPYIEEVLNQGKSFSLVELMLDTGRGTIHCMTSGKPVTDDQGNITGGVVLLRPMDKIQSMVNRIAGAQATFELKDVIGKSSVIVDTVRVASLAAQSKSTILLEGESGTGKEVFAQAIHNASSRNSGPFVAVNCAAIPRELLASELFGYVEGAFTGAKRGGRMGKFELASGGTLFLDEIGDMPLDQQVALLRVLQEKKVTRVGGDTVIPVSVRIICATNKCLANEVEKGNFREDLYYRLNVISINIPPLRNRPGDIPILFNFFLEKTARELGIKIKQIDPEVIDYLDGYYWPGNVRQLQNVVERIVNIARDGMITVRHLPAEIGGMPRREPASIAQVVRINTERVTRKKLNAEKEREEILSLLATSGGNISQVAKELGISRNTVYRKMRCYGIEY